MYEETGRIRYSVRPPVFQESHEVIVMNLHQSAALVHRHGQRHPGLLKSIRVLEVGEPPEVFIAAAIQEFNETHPRLLYVKRRVQASSGTYAFPIISDHNVIFPNHAKRFMKLLMHNGQ